MVQIKNIINIFKKEFKGYFYSPIAYIVISIFLVVTGWFFFQPFFLYNQADIRNFFSLLPLMLSFIIPAVTMRLFSEELNIGSYEVLITLPVTFQDVVIGKFLAALAFIGVMLVPTLSYAIFTAFLGDMDLGPVIGGYIGSLFLSAAFISVGIFASSLSRNQIVSFIIGCAICFALTLIDKMLSFLPTVIVNVFQYLGADYHFQNIAKGILDTRDLVYFVSVSFISLFASDYTMRNRI
jgi:ABC-2 type transport system permease protein